MKTYSTKANARRAAKGQNIDLATIDFKQGTDGKWFWFNNEELKSDVEEKEEPIIGEFVECPCCGIHLSNGAMDNLDWFNEKIQEVSRKQIGWKEAKQVVDQYLETGKSGQYCCLGCGEDFGPEVEFKLPVKKATKASTKTIERKHASEIESPCRVVWDIAGQMPGARRKDVIEACVKAGVAYNTARTQYQRYTAALKGSSK